MVQQGFALRWGKPLLFGTVPKLPCVAASVGLGATGARPRQNVNRHIARPASARRVGLALLDGASASAATVAIIITSVTRVAPRGRCPRLGLTLCARLVGLTELPHVPVVAHLVLSRHSRHLPARWWRHRGRNVARPPGSLALRAGLVHRRPVAARKSRRPATPRLLSPVLVP